MHVVNEVNKSYYPKHDSWKTNLLYALKPSLKLFWHSWPKLWQEIYHLFIQGSKQTYDHKSLLLHDMKFILKDIQTVHQPTLGTKYKMNKKSGSHQSPLGEEILSIKCFHLSLSRCGMRSLETCTHGFIVLDISCLKNHAACSHHFFDIRNTPSYC